MSTTKTPKNIILDLFAVFVYICINIPHLNPHHTRVKANK